MKKIYTKKQLQFIKIVHKKYFSNNILVVRCFKISERAKLLVD